MYDFFGPIEAMQGFSDNQAASYKAADIVNGIVSFKNGVQFQGLWCFNVAEKDKKDRCIIYGSEGTITFSFYAGEIVLDSESEKETFHFDPVPYVQQPLIQATVDYFLGNAENPCPPEAGFEVMRLLEGLSGS